MRSVYVHIPFCEAKCHYCDFYSLGRQNVQSPHTQTEAELHSRFTKALCKEIAQRSPLLSGTRELDTLYFGGGTPSTLPLGRLAEILGSLWRFTSPSANTEITLEANPSSLTQEALITYRSLGINRISLGIQSTQDHHLSALGRVHNRAQALAALEACFQSGFTNVTADLLCGVPGQTLHELEESLQTLTRYPLTHLSCYLLTLAEGNALYNKLPNEETQLEHLLFVHNWLSSHGYEHYEISNFSKPGFRARHNNIYWSGSAYLGLGPSAHSYSPALSANQTPRRWKNISNLAQYCEQLEAGTSPVEWVENLNPEQQRLEKWMLSLRLSDGVPRAWLEKDSQRERAELYLQQGLMEAHPGNAENIRLTARGMALSDTIIAELVK